MFQAVEEPVKKTPEEKFRKVLIQTIVNWAEESQIETPKLVREMFRYKHSMHLQENLGKPASSRILQ